MVIFVGKEVPNFEAAAYYPKSNEVKRLKLSELRGRFVILFFYPADFTFICPTELRDLASIYKDLSKLGAEVLAISTDTVFIHKAWIEAEKLLSDVEYPILADHNGAISKTYGVYNEESGIAERGTFVIDPDGRLAGYEVVQDSIGRSGKELIRKIKALKYVRENPGVACPVSWEEDGITLKPSLELAGKVYKKYLK